MIIQQFVILLAGQTILSTITAVMPHDCGGFRRSRTRAQMIGGWLVWVARDGEVLALAKVCIQSHDYVLGAREAFQDIAERAVHVKGSL